MELTEALAQEYQRLFATHALRPERLTAIDSIADRSLTHQARYEAAGEAIGMPWFVIAAIHNLESGQSFSRHLHNGDPLTARTTHVPPGRPKTGSAPFTWEHSATDALRMRHLDKVGEWTLPVILFQLEGYNGFGYRRHHPEVLSPYLWSFTTAYTRGKFVADGEFSATAVSKQCGAAALLKRLADRGALTLPGAGTTKGGSAVAAGRHVTASSGVAPSPPPFPGVALHRGDTGAAVCLVQGRLRHLGAAIDEVPTCPFGPQTERAVRTFQSTHGLRPSGRVGRDTWLALFR